MGLLSFISECGFGGLFWYSHCRFRDCLLICEILFGFLIWFDYFVFCDDDVFFGILGCMCILLGTLVYALEALPFVFPIDASVGSLNKVEGLLPFFLWSSLLLIFDNEIQPLEMELQSFRHSFK